MITVSPNTSSTVNLLVKMQIMLYRYNLTTAADHRHDADADNFQDYNASLRLKTDLP